MPLAPETRLGPYEIVATIGAGGMGEVYRARDTRLSRDVAIKVMSAAMAADAERQRRFEQEALATAQLNHPNILQVYDVGTHDGQPYLVSELLEGETLRERLDLGAMPVRKAIELAIPIASGLGAAHEQGIVHRDLKPENLFITRDGRVKILDFGLAKLRRASETDSAMTSAQTMEAQTGPGVVMGTAGYMSPEQVRGREVDPRSDIFSFGVILYEMLSGKRAFHGETPADTMSEILRAEPPDLTTLDDSIPLVLQMVVRHCIEKSPGERFRSAHDLAFQLEAISGSGSGAVPKLDEPSAATVARPVRFRSITYRRGHVHCARFGPDGETVLYAAAWDGGPMALEMWRQESVEPISVALPSATLLSISAKGTLAVGLDPHWAHNGGWLGTLATVSMFGGAPREIEERVIWADFAPGTDDLAIVRDDKGVTRIEYPIGNVLYESSGWMSSLRFSPDGEHLAFCDHPFANDDRGSVAVVDRNGNKRVLTPDYGTIQGLAWTPDGREIYFTALNEQMDGRRSLHAVTPNGELRFVTGFPGTGHLFDINGNGKMLLCRNDDRVGMCCKVPGEERERDLSWLDWTIPRDLSSDGKTLLFEEDRASPDYMVCLRKMDGSPPVRLGEGSGLTLSPDGKWALARRPSADAPLQLLPTGIGRPRDIPTNGLDVISAKWLPDGASILCVVRASTETIALYRLDVGSGTMEPMGVERAGSARRGGAVSPDGDLAAMSFLNGKTVLVPLRGGRTVDGPNIEPGEEIVSFSSDGQWLYTERSWENPLPVHRVNIESGRRELWKRFAPEDMAGVALTFWVCMALDGEAYVYAYYKILSDLYVAEGLA